MYNQTIFKMTDTMKTGLRREVLGLFSGGSLIGEMALITENVRVGTAVALDDSVVLRIPRAVMHRIFEEYPNLAYTFYKKLSGSVLETLDEIRELHPKLLVEPQEEQ